MSKHTNVVSIHPYFKVHPGQMDAFKALLPEFCAKTATESLCLWYDFTISGDVVHCRESYLGAEGALAHLQNVGPILERGLKIADLLRLEFHGPAAELEKMKPQLAALNPTWFETVAGVEK